MGISCREDSFSTLFHVSFNDILLQVFMGCSVVGGSSTQRILMSSE